jgi:ketosteroid isomerase-like protein
VAASENFERLRSVYDEWSRGNFNVGLDLFAADVSFRPTVEPKAIRGREGVQEYMAEFLAQWAEYRIVAERFEEDGDTVVVTERQHGIGRGSGVELTTTFYATWVFRDGVVTSVRWDLDPPSP